MTDIRALVTDQEQIMTDRHGVVTYQEWIIREWQTPESLSLIKVTGESGWCQILWCFDIFQDNHPAVRVAALAINAGFFLLLHFCIELEINVILKLPFHISVIHSVGPKQQHSLCVWLKCLNTVKKERRKKVWNRADCQHFEMRSKHTKGRKECLFFYYTIQYSQTRTTASVLKQDLNASNVQKNAVY